MKKIFWLARGRKRCFDDIKGVFSIYIAWILNFKFLSTQICKILFYTKSNRIKLISSRIWKKSNSFRVVNGPNTNFRFLSAQSDANRQQTSDHWRCQTWRHKYNTRCQSYKHSKNTFLLKYNKYSSISITERKLSRQTR